MGHHFRQGQVGRIDVEIAFDDLEVGRDGAEVVVRQRGREVSETEDLPDFAGGEEFLELGRVRKGRLANFLAFPREGRGAGRRRTFAGISCVSSAPCLGFESGEGGGQVLYRG